MRFRLLLIPLLCLLSPVVQAQKPTPSTLLTAQVQDHVDRYFKDPAKQGELTEFRRRILLDARRLSYDPTVPRITWRPRPVVGVRLTIDQKARLEGQLEERLRNVIENYDGGLLRTGADRLDYSIAIAPPRPNLDNVTTEQFRQQLRAFLATRPEAAERLRRDVELTPETLTYRNTPQGRSLTWEVRALRDLTLNEEDRLREDLNDLLVAALRSEGGLLEPEDLDALRPLIRVQIRRPSEARQAQPSSQMVTTYATYFFPNYCHGYLVGWWYVVPIQVPASTLQQQPHCPPTLPSPQGQGVNPSPE